MDQEPPEQPTSQNLIEKYKENGMLLFGKSNVFGIRNYSIDGELGERIDLEHTKLIRTEVDPKNIYLNCLGEIGL